MQITNSFDVAAPIDEVFNTILDVERVIVCVPGAEIVERTSDDAFVAKITVRVGPIRMQYRSDVTIAERDFDNHRATMNIRAKESRGQGTAEATAELTLSPSGGRTHGQVDVDMQVSGRVASMGQGAMQDVSNKIVADFAGNLSEMFVQANTAGGGAVGAQPATPSPGEPPTAEAPPQAVDAPPPPMSSVSASSSADGSLSATGLAGAVIGGRLRDARTLGITFALAVLLGFVLGRRGRG
jgi:uncharacterized protein